ncbi:tRNA glutamyl-Q(34) synthetase GluQRS [Loktanella sp. Alg231-35]|uniref:tRNA glutamyl-Q(34) synthetase GluQRS n=1 Tax=Loktanella sp. Alg231-35 TaxID=1922220 RepID=UPI000D55DBC3|nr:tRNA glutamyl-Q(34) synthetase GluQRS [Loktanella sp. Alg231-35]
MITRFAPSPTGPLHLGHAYSAMLAHDMAMEHNGTFLLRIEDIDRSRARPAWEQQIYDDLKWLGLWWPDPVMRQSHRSAAYQAALDQLWNDVLLYPCHCSRKDIEQAANAPQEGATIGPDGIVYPGTCAGSVNPYEPGERPFELPLRLNMEKATRLTCTHEIAPDHPWASVLSFDEHQHEPNGIRTVTAEHLIEHVGDVVVSRRDMGTSYHLSVVVDDAAQGITDVVRGEDLLDATPIHVILQKLLRHPTPRYHHHRLIRDNQGKRLAKRDDARALTKYRSEGATPNDIRRLVGIPEV